MFEWWQLPLQYLSFLQTWSWMCYYICLGKLNLKRITKPVQEVLLAYKGKQNWACICEDAFLKFPSGFLHVSWMFPICFMNVSCRFPVCFLQVFCMFPEVSCRFPVPVAHPSIPWEPMCQSLEPIFAMSCPLAYSCILIVGMLECNSIELITNSLDACVKQFTNVCPWLAQSECKHIELYSYGFNILKHCLTAGNPCVWVLRCNKLQLYL